MSEEWRMERAYAYPQRSNASAGAVYGLGIVGAAVYFISHAVSFGMVISGILKATVWPAILVYEAFRALG